MAEKWRAETEKEQRETNIRINNMISEGGFGYYFNNEETRLLMQEKIKETEEKRKKLLH
jgi:hypothetical protein